MKKRDFSLSANNSEIPNLVKFVRFGIFLFGRAQESANPKTASAPAVQHKKTAPSYKSFGTVTFVSLNRFRTKLPPRLLSLGSQ